MTSFDRYRADLWLWMVFLRWHLKEEEKTDIFAIIRARRRNILIDRNLCLCKNVKTSMKLSIKFCDCVHCVLQKSGTNSQWLVPTWAIDLCLLFHWCRCIEAKQRLKLFWLPQSAVHLCQHSCLMLAPAFVIVAVNRWFPFERTDSIRSRSTSRLDWRVFVIFHSEDDNRLMRRLKNVRVKKSIEKYSWTKWFVIVNSKSDLWL